MDYPWYLVYVLPGISQQNIYVMCAPQTVIYLQSWDYGLRLVIN